MTQFDQSSVTEPASRKFTRKPVVVTAAALIALSALGLALSQDMRFASAEPVQQSGPTQVPQTAPTFAGAPLTFADLVESLVQQGLARARAMAEVRVNHPRVYEAAYGRGDA